MSQSTEVKVQTPEEFLEQICACLLALEDADSAASQALAVRRDAQNHVRNVTSGARSDQEVKNPRKLFDGRMTCVRAVLRERQARSTLMECLAQMQLLLPDGLEGLGYWLPGQPCDEQQELSAILATCADQMKKSIDTAAGMDPASGKKSLVAIGYSYAGETADWVNYPRPLINPDAPAEESYFLLKCLAELSTPPMHNIEHRTWRIGVTAEEGVSTAAVKAVARSFSQHGWSAAIIECEDPSLKYNICLDLCRR